MEFFKFFGKKEDKESEAVKEYSDELEKVRMICDVIERETIRPTAEIKLVEKKTSIFDSKVGGKPYLPNGESLPLDGDNNPMRLLAQIRCEDIADLPDYPKKGMLQFFIGTDDLMGMDLDSPAVQTGFRVIYRNEIDFTVSEEDIPFPYEEDACFPVDGEAGMEFNITEKGMSANDWRYQELFKKMWNTSYPDNPVKSIFDLSSASIDLIYDTANGCGHHIGGYPFFTQEDPREYHGWQSFDTLLFQLDTDSVGGCEIMWGDCGVGGFFIEKEKLLTLNFEKVLYNWDCC